MEHATFCHPEASHAVAQPKDLEMKGVIGFLTNRDHDRTAMPKSTHSGTYDFEILQRRAYALTSG